MNSTDLSTLNPSQLKALKEIDGQIMVMAGAGSGKTRLVTYRISYLISDLNVLPESILAITFTNKAANEMKERLAGLLGEEVAGRIWISTFHSMCVKILRRHISSLKSAKNLASEVNFNSNFSIYTDTEKSRAIKTVISNLHINKENFEKTVDYHISNAKNNNLSPWEYQKFNQATPDIEDIVKCYSAYQNFLSTNNALDFDDLLVKTYELFKEFPDILKRYQDRFEYIHIDEFQDTNTIQYQIAKLLSGGHNNIFVVGDEDQCIYSWRGANIQNILDFKRDFPEHKLLKLEQNYRSSKQILTLANKLIKNNSVREDKVLWTENNIGVKTDLYKANDEFDEAEFVCSQIKSLVNSDLGYKYSDFAVLMRLNAMTATLEEKFLGYNIPYKIFGGNKFFDRAEIKNVLSYLKILTNPYDSTSFARIINFPKRGIGEASVEKLLQLSTFHAITPSNLLLNSDEYLIEPSLINRVKPFKDVLGALTNAYETMQGLEFIKFLINYVGFKEEYGSSSEEDLSRRMNIDQFVALADKYFVDNPKSNVSEFLQSITLTSDIDDYDEKDNNVTLATVHSVKGLEFRCVFVVGLEERMFPIIRTYSTSSDMEEERRLMFVAITRAKERLSLSYAKSRFVYGKRDYPLPSRFLTESGVLEEQRFNTFERDAVAVPFVSGNKQSFSLNKFKTSAEIKKTENLQEKYAVGVKVSHPKFGTGEITSNMGIQVTKCVSINFGAIGVKTLSVEYAPLTIIKE